MERKREGLMTMACATCRARVVINGEYTGCCPKCGMPFDPMVCIRCGHSWHPTVALPKNCPSCNTPYWNRTRVRPPRPPRAVPAEEACRCTR